MIGSLTQLNSAQMTLTGAIAGTLLLGNVAHADIAIHENNSLVPNTTHSSHGFPNPVPNTSLTSHAQYLDSQSAQALQAILSGDWPRTLQIAQQLTSKFPDYALGHLILAEAHSVIGMSKPLLEELPTYSMPLVDLLLEAKARVAQAQSSKHINAIALRSVPSDIVQVGNHIDHLVLVDLQKSSLYLFDTTDDQPRLIKQHYVSSGEGGFGKLSEGDLKSPLGVYQVRGFRSDESLPDLYGSGALMLDYPNMLDRSLGRTGSGIWLHGNPRKNRSRSPQSSEGCVTMANDHLTDLFSKINMRRTHVVFSANVQWADWQNSVATRERYHELFEQYRSAWINSRVSDLASIYMADALPDHVRYAHAAQAKKVRSELTNSTQLSPDGIDLQALSQVQAAGVSILVNPELEKHHQGRHLVMAFELPGQNAARITIYWERNANGYWQIKREDIDANGA